MVSVPRRGFIVFLLVFLPAETKERMGQRVRVRFQSPEGDSLFFYWTLSRFDCKSWVSFSPPKGIHCFSTCSIGYVTGWELRTSFSPPKGIHCFSTRGKELRVELKLDEFQSPEGDSLFFYRGEVSKVISRVSRFSPPKGIHCFSTRTAPFQ